jgi:hypothetical protein
MQEPADCLGFPDSRFVTLAASCHEFVYPQRFLGPESEFLTEVKPFCGVWS